MNTPKYVRTRFFFLSRHSIFHGRALALHCNFLCFKRVVSCFLVQEASCRRIFILLKST